MREVDEKQEISLLWPYDSISRYADRGISAHIPRRDLVIFACCVLIDYH